MSELRAVENAAEKMSKLLESAKIENPEQLVNQ